MFIVTDSKFTLCNSGRLNPIRHKNLTELFTNMFGAKKSQIFKIILFRIFSLCLNRSSNFHLSTLTKLDTINLWKKYGVDNELKIRFNDEQK